VVACYFLYTALEKAVFPTITPAIVRQARKNYAGRKIYNTPVVITKTDDAPAATQWQVSWLVE
jgi:hypothetical protein